MTGCARRRVRTCLRAELRPRRSRSLAGVKFAGVVGLSVAVAAAPAMADTQRAAEWPIASLDLTAVQQISTGRGVTVGLLDSGVMGQRADLVGQVTTGPDYAGGVEQPGSVGWGEHGTCMASIIAGHGHGPGGADGTLGVAPGAHILSVRVIRDDNAPDVNQPVRDPNALSDGINYAVAHGVQVISMSLGITGAGADTPQIAQAIRNAVAHNVVVVVAAGNGAAAGNPISYPAADPGVITVTAVTQSGQHAAFATSGWDVDVAAPGVNIPCDAPDHNNEYVLGDGTSQATAFAAGLAALIKSVNPALSPAQVRGLLEQTASAKPVGGRNDEVGYGTIDPLAAVRAAQRLRAVAQAPVAGAGPSSGYFGYGPTHVVAERSAFISPLMRAASGGAVLLLLGGYVFFRGVRRRRPPSSPSPPPATGSPPPSP